MPGTSYKLSRLLGSPALGLYLAMTGHALQVRAHPAHRLGLFLFIVGQFWDSPFDRSNVALLLPACSRSKLFTPVW